MLNYSGGFELAHALPELVPTNIPVEGSRSPGYTVVGHITTDKVTSGTCKAAYPHQRFTPVFSECSEEETLLVRLGGS